VDAVAQGRKKLLHGTLDTLILKTLGYGPRHGYAIARWLEEQAGGAILIEEGSLYPALYRLEKGGFLYSEWGKSELARRAKFYRLTERGETRLEVETREWERFSRVVTAVLRPDPAHEH
jgi:PadR family transcriptional regulator PadR